MSLTMKMFFKLLLWLLAILIVVGVFAFFNLNRAAVQNELVALYLIPRPEKLTELYFTNNANLPSSEAGNQEIRFSFVIHNLETVDYRYTYNVSVNTHGVRHSVDSGNILVKNNQYYVKGEKLTLANFSGSQQIIVELTNKRQSIDFWIGKQS